MPQEFSQIKLISWSQIEEVWRTQLWPERVSKIEPVSWISPLGTIDMSMQLGEPSFLGVQELESESIVGVVSGHSTGKGYFRSRGLWVSEEHRRNGFASKLMSGLAEIAQNQGHHTLWTMPRLTSWPFYQKVDFVETGRINGYEFGPHILAAKNLNALLGA